MARRGGRVPRADRRASGVRSGDQLSGRRYHCPVQWAVPAAQPVRDLQEQARHGGRVHDPDRRRPVGDREARCRWPHRRCWSYWRYWPDRSRRPDWPPWTARRGWTDRQDRPATWVRVAVDGLHRAVRVHRGYWPRGSGRSCGTRGQGWSDRTCRTFRACGVDRRAGCSGRARRRDRQHPVRERRHASGEPLADHLQGRGSGDVARSLPPGRSVAMKGCDHG